MMGPSFKGQIASGILYRAEQEIAELENRLNELRRESGDSQAVCEYEKCVRKACELYRHQAQQEADDVIYGGD